MKRLTSNNYHEMDMYQLELNQVYIGSDGWPRYVKAPEEECGVCDLIRNAAETLSVDLPIPSDEALSDLMADFLQYGEEEPEGVLAILYRALCAMAELHARLTAYEDTGLGPEEITDLQRAWDMYGGEEGITAMLAPPPNAPLTLEELREMDGEPVWVVWAENWRHAEWALVHKGAWSEETLYFLARGGDYPLIKPELESGTRAYRRKPEEGTT